MCRYKGIRNIFSGIDKLPNFVKTSVFDFRYAYAFSFSDFPPVPAYHHPFTKDVRKIPRHHVVHMTFKWLADYTHHAKAKGVGRLSRDYVIIAQSIGCFKVVLLVVKVFFTLSIVTSFKRDRE